MPPAVASTVEPCTNRRRSHFGHQSFPPLTCPVFHRCSDCTVKAPGTEEPCWRPLQFCACCGRPFCRATSAPPPSSARHMARGEQLWQPGMRSATAAAVGPHPDPERAPAQREWQTRRVAKGSVKAGRGRHLGRTRVPGAARRVPVAIAFGECSCPVLRGQVPVLRGRNAPSAFAAEALSSAAILIAGLPGSAKPRAAANWHGGGCRAGAQEGGATV